MNNYDDDSITHGIVELRKSMYALEVTLKKDFMMEPIEVREDYMDYIIMQFRAGIWSEDVDDFQIAHPEDWWQAFKERWFPGWALNRWPVKNRVHKVNVKALYPSFLEMRPKQEHVFKIHSIDWEENKRRGA